MILVDVNLLVYAHRNDAYEHDRYREWLSGATRGPQAFGMSDLALSSFVRIVTNPRMYTNPTPIDYALEFVNAIRARAACVLITPGPRHWEIFTDLCRRANVKGAMITDAWFAALAIESGSEWITNDRDFARFPGLRWRHPFDDLVSERGAPYRAGRAIERDFLVDLLRRNGKSLPRAAKEADMDRKSLDALLRKHHISPAKL